MHQTRINSEEDLFKVLQEEIFQVLGVLGFGKELLMRGKKLVDGWPFRGVFLQAVLDKVSKARVPGPRMP